MNCSLKTKTFLDTLLCRKLWLFLAVGLPGFLIAIPLNIFFVESLDLAIWLAYAIVLIIQVTINFFACLFFVFELDPSRGILKKYFSFIFGIGSARFLDWILYTVLTEGAGFNYILIQIFNVLIFSLAKFSFSRRVFEKQGR